MKKFINQWKRFYQKPERTVNWITITRQWVPSSKTSKIN